MVGTGLWVGGRRECAHAPELPGGERLVQGVQEQSPEQAGQDTDRQEAPRAAGHPVGPVRGEPPAGDDAMEMGVVHERLSPRMEHREDADLRAQMPGIGDDGPEGVGDGPKEEAVDHRLVLGRNLRDRPGQGEDDVDVLNVEQVRLARLDPRRARERLALVAVPTTAGVIPDAPVAASAGPPRHTSSESCGAGGVTLSRHCTTSSELSTTGKVCGFFGAGITVSIRHGFLSVTL